ncbi:hypothetical protein EDC94DRAFT_594334, partial [Helicostylum pulchrum]
MSSYGMGGGYPPGMYGQQQQLMNYPMSNYYNTGMGYGGGGGGYYPNSTAYLSQGGYGVGGGGMYGGGGGYGGGGYGAGLYGNSYLPYKQSTIRSIYNRIRHGSSYGHYPYYNQSYNQMGYDYGRHHHRGSYLDY